MPVALWWRPHFSERELERIIELMAAIHVDVKELDVVQLKNSVNRPLRMNESM